MMQFWMNSEPAHICTILNTCSISLAILTNKAIDPNNRGRIVEVSVKDSREP